VYGSSYVGRILTYDFAKKAGIENTIKMFGMMFGDRNLSNSILNTPNRVPVVYALWQCYISEVFDLKDRNSLRNRFLSITNKAQFRHPYSRWCDRRIELLERDIINSELDLWEAYNMLNRNFSNGSSVMGEYVSGNSLLRHRLLDQYDFFSLCSDENRELIVSKSNSAEFFYQMMDNEDCVDWKYRLYKHIKTYSFVGDFNTRNVKSYPEMMMDHTLRGEDVSRAEILELIMNKPKILVDWMEDDAEGLDRILHVTDLLERIIENGDDVDRRSRFGFVNTLEIY